MAKTKPQDRRLKGDKRRKMDQDKVTRKLEPTPEQMLGEAMALLQSAQPDQALEIARHSLAKLQPSEEPRLEALPALNLLGEICVELGDVETAREYFLVAAQLDPDGEIPEEVGGGSEKYLWLAQLCEEGGEESVQYFELGASILRRQISVLESMSRRTDLQAATLDEKKRKMANALCGIVEVYMTDLSWEEDAESKCEAMVTEAMMVAPTSPEVLQTLANVRLSQSQISDAQSALRRSLELWKDLPPEDERVPDFSTRISLARLLMEAEMRDEALEVLERLITEDDSSVEAWYLGGWCLYLLGRERREQNGSSSSPKEDGETVETTLKTSRQWLLRALKIYGMLDYEDERLRDHAQELVNELIQSLGPVVEGEEEEDGDEWGDEDISEDEEMEGT